MIISNGSLRPLSQSLSELGDVGMSWVRGRLFRTTRFIRYMHAGQKDKSGRPYWTHPYRVMMRLRDVPRMTEAVLHAALLHDIIEDTKCTMEELWRAGYPWLTLCIVDDVTRYQHRRDRGETYEHWIAWLAEYGNLGTKLVKVADIADNLDPERVARLPKEFRGLERKYIGALELFRSTMPEDSFRAVKFGSFSGSTYIDPAKNAPQAAVAESEELPKVDDLPPEDEKPAENPAAEKTVTIQVTEG